MLSQQTPLRTWRPRSKTKKVSHLISKDSFLLESNWKMEEPFLTTTSKRNPPSILSLDLEEVVTVRSRSSQHLQNLPESTNAIRWFAEDAMLSSHQRPLTAERESVDIMVISDQRKSSSADFFSCFCNRRRRTHQEILQY